MRPATKQYANVAEVLYFLLSASKQSANVAEVSDFSGVSLKNAEIHG